MATLNVSNKARGPTKGSPRMDFLQRHALAAYFVLAFAITWLIAWPLLASAQGLLRLPMPFALHYLTAYGPLLAALLVTGLTAGAVGLRELVGRMFKWRVGIGWILISAFSLVALFAVAAIIAHLLGEPWPNLRQLGQVDYLPNLGVGTWLFWILTSGFGEETGWRGFALPRLQKTHSALTATLIVAVFWVLWHVPFFFYLATYLQLGWAMFPVFALGILAGAIVLTWLYNSTNGSILMPALFHGTLNFVTATPASAGAIAAIISIVIMVWAVFVVIAGKPANLSHRTKQVFQELRKRRST